MLYYNNFIIISIFLPFFSFFFILLFGRLLGNKIVCYFSLFNMFLSFSNFLFFFLFTDNFFIYKLFPWISLDDLVVSWEFYFDINSLIMCCLVSFISFLVHLYSISYMENDLFQSSFMSYLSLFTFFMLILVTSGNFFQMFLGWEGVGLCSFLLISFWSDRVYAVTSALKAIILNRIGDIGLIIVIVLVYFEFGSVDFSIVFLLAKNSIIFYNFLGFQVNFYSLISIFLLLAAIGKSSQYLLHGWLPDAMEGPTPVSALIHAATMVTAGVFLLIRCNVLLLNSPRILILVSLIGFLTCLFGSLTGSRVYDLKKMIAYSTTSHLGYMFMACGLLATNIALFHLVIHACFKALLFLSAGSIIHGYNNEQDVRKMSGIDIFFPITSMSLIVGTLSMNGIFGLSGALSKDNILFSDFFGYGILRFYAFGLLIISVFLGALYSARIISFFFNTKFSGSQSLITKIHESDMRILIPFILLTFLSIYLGFFLENFFKDEYSSIWFGGRTFLFNNYSNYFGEFNNSLIFFNLYGEILSDEKICFLIENVACFGIFFSIYLNKINFEQLFNHLSYKNLYKKDFFYFFFIYFQKRSMTDRIYNKIFASMQMRNSKVYFFDILERSIFELFGYHGMKKILLNFYFLLNRLTTGFLHNYIYFFVNFFFLFFLYFYVYNVLSIIFLFSFFYFFFNFNYNK